MKHVKYCVPKESLAMLYEILVKPYLRYCNTTWGECGQPLISKLKTLQNRAAKVVGIKYEEADHDPKVNSAKGQTAFVYSGA